MWLNGRLFSEVVDSVFKALPDPTRRDLLDALFAQDGQTLTALEERVPMARLE